MGPAYQQIKERSTCHYERALFVIGEQNSGKSTQLRSMFRDWRLGKRGKIPQSPNIGDLYMLSNERWLYLRLTSPHERNETLTKFLNKCAQRMRFRKPQARRWNFACPLQPYAASKMPDANHTIQAFIARFAPERIRVAILSPDQSGNSMSSTDLNRLAHILRRIKRTEVITTDARALDGNGLIYADFFDFT